MDIAKINKFYTEILSDEKVQKNLEKDIKNVRNICDLRKIINEKIMPKIKEKGLDISAKELLDYEKESLKSLTEEDLVNINGGLSLKSVFLGGGLLSMMFLGMGSVNSQTASAVVTGEQIKTNTQEMIRNLENIPSANPEPFAGADGEEVDNEEDTAGADGEEVDNEEDTAGADGEEVDNSRNETEPGITLEAVQQTTQNQTGTNEGSSQTEQKTDNKYIMEAGNLVDPYILLMSETIARFRFLDGNKTTLNFGAVGGDGIPEWDFKKDSGDGSANLMTSLFPSSAGILSAGGGYGGMYPLNAINPSPELIAHILNFIHDYRNDTEENKNEKRGAIDKIFKDLDNSRNFEKMKEKFNGFNERYKIQTSTNLSNILGKEKSGSIIKELKSINTKISGKYTGDLNLEGLTALWNEYKKYLENPFFNIEQQFETFQLPKVSGALEDTNKANYYKTIVYILKNGMYIIDNQEESETDSERILPKYMLERMMMSFFISHFNDDQVEPFYAEAKKIIKTDENQDLESIIENLRNKLEIIKQIKVQENCPYKSQLSANGKAKKVEIGSDGKLKFTSTFADCADTAGRHVINLLSYNKEFGWSSILGPFDETQRRIFEDKIDTILINMRNGQAFAPDSLQDRFKTFIYYQSQRGADDSSEEARSFWNYVISNMTEVTEEVPYSINYVQGNNELNTGFLNCVKLIYNLVNSLGQNSEKLENAKKEIDELNEIIKNKNKEQLKGQAKKALESTFGILSSGCGIEFKDDLEIGNDDFYGTIIVKKLNGVSFPIMQSQGHSAIKFNPISITPLNLIYRNFVKEDPVVQLLSKDFKVKVEPSKMCQFNKLFGGQEILERSTQYSKNVGALKFLKDLQGEGNNTERIQENLKKELLESNIKAIINVEKNKKEEQALSLFIFYNFINKVLHKPNNILKKEEIINFFKSNNSYLENINGVDYIYSYKTDGSVAVCPIITQDKNQVNQISIPAEIKINNKNKKVSGIWGISFFATNDFENIDIVFDENIEVLEIYDNTFNGIKIKNIVFPSHIKTLKFGKKAFFKSAIETLDLSKCENTESLSIADNAFEKCSQLKTVSFPTNLNSLEIGEYAFSNSAIETLDLSKCESLKSLDIKSYAFKSCAKLEKVIFPASLTLLKFGEYAFSESSITEIDLSNCVLQEGLEFKKYAFAECKKLGTLSFPENLTLIKIGVNAFDKSSITEVNFSNCVNLKILEIGACAFTNCKQLNTFSFSPNLVSLKIGEYAFYKSSLKELDLSNCISLKSIEVGKYSFNCCEKLRKIIFSASITSLEVGKNAFAESRVTEINFSNCASLKSLKFKRSAFWKCKKLKKVIFSESITSLEIGESAFAESTVKLVDLSKCEALKYLKFGKTAFAKSLIENVDLSNCIVLEYLELGAHSFWSCNRLKKVKFPASITSLEVGKNAFAESSIVEVDLSNCIVLESLKLGENDFFESYQLETILFPENLNSLEIGESAFAESAIETLDLSKCTVLEKLKLGACAFSTCGQLKTVLFSENLNSLEIGESAFAESGIEKFDLSVCGRLESLILKGHSFYKCGQLKTFLSSANLTSLEIGESAFAESALEELDLLNCKNLEKAVVKGYAFRNCKQLKKILFPESLNSLELDESVFDGI